MHPPHVQIFTAIELERRALEHALTSAPASTPHWQLTTVGVRASRCPTSLGGSTRLVLLAGLAGGLDPTLQVGDLVIEYRPNFTLADLTPSPSTSARFGRIATSPNPVCSPDDKMELFGREGALAVEMEGAIVSKLAASAGVPFIHLRAISDAADTVLDPRLLTLVDDIGRPRPLRIAGYLARDPRRIAALQRLRRDTTFALDRLGWEMVRLLPQLNDLVR